MSREIRLTVGEEGQRLDKLLSGELPELSRSALQSLIAKGCVTSGGKALSKSAKLPLGQEVTVLLPDPAPLEVEAQDIPLDIVYEDGDLLVVNKPKGMVVHPAPGNPDGTLVNALLYHCGESLSGINGVIRPGIVHRIDKDTSGLLVIAKNDEAHQALSEQMSVHSIHRVYHAVVYGNLKEDAGFVEAPIGRDPRDRKKMAVTENHSRYAYTGWQVLERFGSFTYIACRLKTGRTHQIRVHMASIGHPLLGDSLYHPDSAFPMARQALHSFALEFTHPITEKAMRFTAPLPLDMQAWLNRA